jgi:putative FmdB family regulatory protein
MFSRPAEPRNTRTPASANTGKWEIHEATLLETRLLGTLVPAGIQSSPAWRVSGVRPAHEHGSCLEEPAMPTYEYHCKKCGMTFERNEHIAEHEKSHPRCPKCKSEAVEPVLADFYAKTSKKA